MSIYALVRNKNFEEAQRIAQQQIERQHLLRELRNMEMRIQRDNLSASLAAEFREKIPATRKQIAQLDVAIAKRWTTPSREKLQKLNGMAIRTMSHRTHANFAESAISAAIREERPKKEAEARKQLAEFEREYAKARGELSKALTEVGLDPKAL
jgi:hypothetical protein